MYSYCVIAETGIYYVWLHSLHCRTLVEEVISDTQKTIQKSEALETVRKLLTVRALPYIINI